MTDDEFLNSISGVNPQMNAPSNLGVQPSGKLSDDEFLQNVAQQPRGSIQNDYTMPQPKAIGSEGSMLETLKARGESIGQAWLAAHVGPEYSAYANRRAKRAYDDYQAENAKQSGMMQLATGVSEFVPIAAASMVNPAIGAGLMGLSSYGESLSEQAGQGLTPSAGRAGAVALGSGAVDFATGGLASKMIRGLPTQGAVDAALSAGKQSLMRRAAPVGIEMGQGAVANSAAQVFTNLSAGKDWSEGAADAAVFGAGGAGVVRGGAGALSKLNAQFKVPLTDSAKGVFQSANEMFLKRGYKPAEGHIKEAAASKNLRADMQSKIDPTRYDFNDPVQVKEYEDNIQGAVNLSRLEGGAAADMEAMSMFVDNNIDILDTAYAAKVSKDLDGNDSYSMHEKMGVSMDDMAKIGEAREKAHLLEKGKGEAMDKASYAEADAAKFQKDFQAMSNKAYGTMDTNINTVRNERMQMEQAGIEAQYLQPLRKLEQALTTIKNTTTDLVNPRSPSDPETLAMAAADAYRYAGEAGMLDKLLNVKGKTGDYDPITGAMTLERLDKMAGARMYNVKQGTPNIHAPRGSGEGQSFMMQMADAMPMGAGPIARKASLPFTKPLMERKASDSREKLLRAKGFSKQRAEDIVNMMRREEAGVTPPPEAAPVNKMESAEVQVKSDIEDLKNTELFPETNAPVQAPVVAPEAVVPRTGPVAPTRPEVAQRAVEEPTMAPEEVMPQQMAEPLPMDPRQQAMAPEAPAQQPLPMDEIDALLAKQWEADEAARWAGKEGEVAAARQAGDIDVSRPQQAVPEVIPEAPVAPERLPRDPRQVVEEVPEAPAPQAPVIDAAKLEAMLEEAFNKPAPKAPKSEKVKASKPKAKEKAPEPTPEPVEAPSEPRTRVPAKKPTKDLKKAEEPVESVTEPVVEPKAEPKAEPAPKKSPIGMFAKNIKSMEAKVDTLSKKPRGEVRKELLEARQEVDSYNKMVNKVSDDLKMREDEIAEAIEGIGGFEGLKKEAASQNRKGEETQILKNHIKEVEAKAAKVAQAAAKDLAKVTSDAKKVSSEVVSEQAQARAVADKHMGVRDRLEARGYDKDIIDEALKRGKASDTTKDFDPALVNEWAKNLQSKADAKVKEDARVAKEHAEKKLKNLKPTLSNQRKKIDKYLKESQIGTDPTVAELVAKEFSHKAGKALTDAQMTNLLRRIDTFAEQQQRAYEAVLRQPKTDFTPTEQADNAMKFQKWKDARKNIEQGKKELQAEIDQNKAELEKASKESEVARMAEDKAEKARLKREGEAKEAQRNVEKQEADLVADLKKYGATDAFIEQNVPKSFYRRTTPMSESQVSNLYKAMTNKVDADKAATAKAVESKVKEVVSEMSTPELKATSSEVVSEFGKYENPAHVAAIKSITDVMRSRGLKKEADLTDTLSSVVQKAREMQKSHPDNMEYWISGDDKVKLQSLFSEDVGSTYWGNLGKKLKLEFYGDTKKDHMNLSRKEINQRIAGESIGEGFKVVEPRKARFVQRMKK